jgi:RNA polymerase sigma-70 factor, ECF subfamily
MNDSTHEMRPRNPGLGSWSISSDEELLAEYAATFLKLHLKCHQFEPGRSVRPWLYTIVTNQAIDLVRRNRRHKAISLNTAMCGHGGFDEARSMQDLLNGREADPGERMESSENQQRIRLSLEKLPDRLKQVLIMIVFQGLRYRDVAEVVGILSAANTVRASSGVIDAGRGNARSDRT